MTAGVKDPYVYEQADASGLPVLKNRFGIREFHSLRNVEYELATLREVEWREAPKSNSFDFDHLKAIHKQVFGDLYDWAGQERTVNLQKGKSSFIPANVIQTMADVTSIELKSENYLRGLKKADFVQKLAVQYQSWNQIHPFREGNGRATRIFLTDLAEQAGYVFQNSVIERNKDLWNRAAMRSMPSNENDIGELKAIFNQVVVDSRAYHLAKTSPEIAMKKHPELLAVYQDVNAKTVALKGQPDEFKRAVQQEMKRHIYEIANGKSALVQATPTVANEGRVSTREKGVINSEPKKDRGAQR